MMRRSCNLELQLLPPSSDSCLPLPSSEYKSPYDQYQQLGLYNNIPKKEQQELTIFYNGKMVSCDVTEFQARAIILLARRENEEISKSPIFSSSSKVPAAAASTLMQSQQLIYGPITSGLSMKKSLQQFLQKRKNRMQAASPYHH